MDELFALGNVPNWNATLSAPNSARPDGRSQRHHQRIRGRPVMTKFGLMGAAVAVLAAGFANPLMAQAVIDYPAACAQCPGNPYAGGYQPGAGDLENLYAMSDQDSSYCSRRYRSDDPTSGSYLGYDGRLHPCL